MRGGGREGEREREREREREKHMFIVCARTQKHRYSPSIMTFGQHWIADG
jgi:hypothetical protein